MHVTLEASACQPVCMVNVSKSSQLCKADEMEQWKCIELICQQKDQSKSISHCSWIETIALQPCLYLYNTHSIFKEI